MIYLKLYLQLTFPVVREVLDKFRTTNEEPSSKSIVLKYPLTQSQVNGFKSEADTGVAPRFLEWQEREMVQRAAASQEIQAAQASEKGCYILMQLAFLMAFAHF